MRLKKVLSLVTAISTMLVTSSYQIAFAESDFTEIPDVTPESKISEELKEQMETINTRPGDINLDGNINNTDVTLLNKYLSGSVSLSGNMQKYMADVNRDGEINSLDAVLLQQILLEI